MADASSPIGVFDSGVGGLSTLGSLIRELPGEDFLFYGDTAHAPYGTRTREEILGYVRGVVAYLLSRDVKALVIACNTATSVAAADLRAELSLPIIGIEPALKPASLLRRNGQILVLATPVTLRLEKFRRLMEHYGEHAVPVPCPGLMDLVEQEDYPGAERYLRSVFSGFDMDQVDAVVLGCTHYVFLRPMVRELLPERIHILDGNEGTARQLRRVLDARSLLNPRTGGGHVTLETSGNREQVLPVMERMMATSSASRSLGTFP